MYDFVISFASVRGIHHSKMRERACSNYESRYRNIGIILALKIKGLYRTDNVGIGSRNVPNILVLIVNAENGYEAKNVSLIKANRKL